MNSPFGYSRKSSIYSSCSSSKSSRSNLSTTSTAKCHSPITPTSQIHCHQTWVIHNFSQIELNTFGSTFESIRFDSSSIVPKLIQDKIQFSLRLDPSFSDYANEDDTYVSLYLQFHSTEIHQHSVDYQFSIIGEEGERLYSRGGQAKFDQLIKCLGFPKFISRNDLLNSDNVYLFQDSLTIYCEVFYTPNWILKPSSTENFPFDFKVQINSKAQPEKSIPLVHSLAKLYPSLDDEMRDLIKIDEAPKFIKSDIPKVETNSKVKPKEEVKTPKISSKQRKFSKIWKLFSPNSENGKGMNNGKSNSLNAESYQPVMESYKRFDDVW